MGEWIDAKHDGPSLIIEGWPCSVYHIAKDWVHHDIKKYVTASNNMESTS